MEQKKMSFTTIISVISATFALVCAILSRYSKYDRMMVQVDVNTKNIEKLAGSVEDLKESVTILVTKMEQLNK